MNACQEFVLPQLPQQVPAQPLHEHLPCCSGFGLEAGPSEQIVAFAFGRGLEWQRFTVSLADFSRA